LNVIKLESNGYLIGSTQQIDFCFDIESLLWFSALAVLQY
jgi:hypothetical protein